MRKIRVALLVISAVAALAVISTPWILRAVSPQAACEVALVIRPDLVPLDPWGQPWQDRGHLLRQNPRLDPTAFYSSGPNGRAEEGEGDDVIVSRYKQFPRWQLILRLRYFVLAGVGAVALWLAFAPGIGRPRAGRRREFLRLVGYGSVPMLILGGGLLLLSAPASSDRDPPWLLASREIATGGGGALLGLLLVLGVRLSLPTEAGPEAARDGDMIGADHP